jgi:hypothetical protein
MGLVYRKTIKIGPLNINLSKSGVGFSLGVKGARVGRTAKGKIRTTLSIPGTGLSYVTTKDSKNVTKKNNTGKKKIKDVIK